MTLREPVLPSLGLRRDQCGFSLVELAVVLVVLGLVAVSALPFLQQWKEASDMRTAAVKIADIMLSARMKAVVERRDYTVSVTYTSDTWSVNPAVENVQLAGSVDLYQDTTDPDCPPLSSRNIVFRPNGTADAAGFEAVYLKSRSANVSVRYRVKILGATGNVSVEKWAGGAWVSLY